ncbi:cell division protein FtsA [Aquifex pyrophilus]
MIYTGIDGSKWFSISYSLLKKTWKPVKKKGRKIYVIPSHLCLLKREKLEEGLKASELKEFLIYEAEEYGANLWDFKAQNGFYYVVFVKDFSPPEDYYALDCEIFSLARISKVLEKPNLKIIDIGRRKTTFVEVKDYEVKSYRVILKGAEFLKEKGNVKEAFEEILESSGLNWKGEEVLLSGGGSRIVELEEFFKVIRNPYCEPELNSAFGASLKYVYKDPSPEFRKLELTPSEQKALLLITGLATLSFISYFSFKDYVKKKIVMEVNREKKILFSQKFPNMPPILVEEQLKTIKKREKNEFFNKLYKAFSNLPEGVKIYRIEYKKGILKIVGEADEKNIKLIKTERIRKTPEGNYEFEVVIK